jgi:hypothetical protein
MKKFLNKSFQVVFTLFLLFLTLFSLTACGNSEYEEYAQIDTSGTWKSSELSNFEDYILKNDAAEGDFNYGMKITAILTKDSEKSVIHYTTRKNDENQTTFISLTNNDSVCLTMFLTYEDNLFTGYVDIKGQTKFKTEMGSSVYESEESRFDELKQTYLVCESVLNSIRDKGYSLIYDDYKNVKKCVNGTTVKYNIVKSDDCYDYYVFKAFKLESFQSVTPSLTITAQTYVGDIKFETKDYNGEAQSIENISNFVLSRATAKSSESN